MEYSAEGRWDGKCPFVYAYRTMRDDGWTFAVGRIMPDSARPNGSIALFETAADLEIFLSAMERDGAMVCRPTSLERLAGIRDGE